jgi:uncharacterized repeat protein (TIGR02543 family)
MFLMLICASCENPWMIEILEPKTITFDSNGGSHVSSQDLIKGKKVKRPTDPSRNGYIFDAWYVDNNTFVKQWNFNTVPTEGFTLYAKWNPIHDHIWGEWIVTANATETTDGVETRTCSVCNEKETRSGGEYAIGTSGLAYALINGNTAYRVSQGTATGNIVIPAYRLYNGNYLPVTTVSNGTDSWWSGAFGEGEVPNTAVTRITFAADSQLTTISENAFIFCTGLTSITLPESVTTIGLCAFEKCTGLASITIPAGVTSVGNSVFYEWTPSQTIYIQGKASQAEADAVWGAGWTYSCNAVIKYWNGSGYQ